MSAVQRPEPARVLVADPPWSFRDSLPGPKRGASKHYRCMSSADICRLRLPPIATNAVLFLWSVSSMLQEALDVTRAWGFSPKAQLAWVKTTRRSTADVGAARLAFGMGHQVRNCHEPCIIATRGRVPPKNRSVRSVFLAPLGAHSAKPDEFYELVEAMHDGPYVELFARRQRSGWTCLGNEIGSTLEVA